MTYGRRSLGANSGADGTSFEVWAPEARRIELLIEGGPGAERFAMQRGSDGYWALDLPNVRPGSLYRYAVDGGGPFPDPASRYQPHGVHGSSQVVDAGAFAWNDGSFRPVALRDSVLYELHVGTFSAAGTFLGAVDRLDSLRSLGVTTIELMPLADFPGARNWGYDGVALFAPARCYGTPDELRTLVDAAHSLGLSVFLDVVYNHFGPDGAYQGMFSPHYASRVHRSPWGDTLNFDGAYSRPVRDYVVENALRWVREYHIDGLRLDATHAIADQSAEPIVAELVDALRCAEATDGRAALAIVEDARNLRLTIDRSSSRGWGADGVWSDDFHHQMRRALAGDSDGYFADFNGSVGDIATTARQGWFFTGQPSHYFGTLRGTDPSGLLLERFVFFLQNHDQIGNRAFGDRLHHRIDAAVWRAASVLLFLLPETPLVFMGQEWMASAPFQFFTDHARELGQAVTEGRRREFSRFAAFADASQRERIPDPQASSTFEASKLDWDECERTPHREALQLYNRLTHLRRSEPALRQPVSSGTPAVSAVEPHSLLVRRDAYEGRSVLGVVRLRGEGAVDVAMHEAARAPGGRVWQILLHSEAPEFTPDAHPPIVDLDGPAPRVTFARPGALVLASEDPG